MFRVQLAPLGACAALALASTTSVEAKPIAFANGTTIMAEYGAGTMIEAQAFYAPTWWLSAGGGYVRFDSDTTDRTRDIAYVRANYLAKRWNMPSAQANVFAWGGLGSATGNTFDGTRLARNVGAQLERGPAALMRSHGAITYGGDLGQAVENMRLLEWACTVYWRAKMIGEPAVMTQEQAEDVVKVYTERNYGRLSEA